MPSASSPNEPSCMPSQLAKYQSTLAALKVEKQFRQCRTLTPSGQHPMQVAIDGIEAINFSGNDYLGLSRDTRLQTAAIEAIHQYGIGSASSRLVSGTSPLAVALENELATFKQTESALVFGSGYQANVGILQALLKPGDQIFCDRLNHASLVDGCRLSGARWHRYRHLDLEHLETLLAKSPTEAAKWIITDSVFSMDGDYPDLSALVTLAERYNALIMVDEAHATGIYGAKKRSGLCEQFHVSNRVHLQMGTFSKALGGSGGYLAGSRPVIDTLINRARGFIYSTAPSPPVLAAALEAVRVIQADDEPTQRLWANIRVFESQILQNGLSQLISSLVKSPIIPIIVGDSAKTVALSHALLEAGHFVQAIRPPTVPNGTARLRISLSAAHTTDQIDTLIQSLARLLKELS
jgi:8-amino-7-oxononanoate synthase